MSRPAPPGLFSFYRSGVFLPVQYLSVTVVYTTSASRLREARAYMYECQIRNTLVPYCLPSTVVGNGCTSWETLRFEVFTWRFTSTSLGDSIISKLV